ncbi:MAG: hypothetical protein A2Y08_03190 [Planctomycetes bacterium GWA2_40_7]|nr:MAG: hypothetical protein A2Y08_03190 [Planctomycetes bacterium GWA2_40_7]
MALIEKSLNNLPAGSDIRSRISKDEFVKSKEVTWETKCGKFIRGIRRQFQNGPHTGSRFFIPAVIAEEVSLRQDQGHDKGEV